MKPITRLKVLFSSAILTSSLVLTGCANKEEKNHLSHHDSMKTMKEHAHTHSHGHSDAHTEKSYEMTFTSEPSSIEAGKSASLYFKPEEIGHNGSKVPLDLVHEMKVHLFIISKDLSYFVHEHPDEISEGRYLLKHTFPSGGEYILFQNYTPTGSTHQLGSQVIKVEGKEVPIKSLGNQTLTWEGNQYKATLSSGQSFKANLSLELKATIYKNGKPVTDLDNYLGALAHIVIVSEDGKEYVHVHPMESEKRGPDILLHTNFPKKGKYKVFMQFKHKGEVQTSSFVVDAV